MLPRTRNEILEDMEICLRSLMDDDLNFDEIDFFARIKQIKQHINK